jgi:hypothetical protein
MEGDEAQCARRIESLLDPHLGEQITWLCGSFGLVDEQAVEFLTSHNQKVVVVGYHSYDISDHMLDFVEQHDIPFVDARKEQVLKGISAPSERDILFLSKADLVILLWNGESAGTREMIEWYSEHQKDHVVGFF